MTAFTPYAVDEVMSVNFSVLTSEEKRRGRWGLLNRGNLEYALDLPDMTISGVSMYGDLYSKVAALMHNITVSHPFVEGNKRTGFTLADTIMIMNGYVIVARKTERCQISLAIDEGHMSVEDVALWLKDNSLQATQIVPSTYLDETERFNSQSNRKYVKKTMLKKRLIIYKRSSRASRHRKEIKEGMPYIYRY